MPWELKERMQNKDKVVFALITFKSFASFTTDTQTTACEMVHGHDGAFVCDAVVTSLVTHYDYFFAF